MTMQPLFVAMTYAGLCLNHACAAPLLDKGHVARLDKMVSDFKQQQSLPAISMAVGIENQLAHTLALGETDVENQVPAKPQSVFRTASIAKSMTAVAVMQLVEQGNIDLDRPVAETLPHIDLANAQFSVRQLLAHIAGIRHYEHPGEALQTLHYNEIDTALGLFTRDRLVSEPGERYLYSTFGYNLLGAIVESTSGQSFVDYLRQQVWHPADMNKTCADDHFEAIANRARGYVRADCFAEPHQLAAIGAPLEPGRLYNAPLHDTSSKIPGGGLLSTPSDLVRFASALSTGDLLGRDTLELMITEQRTLAGEPTGYGLGFYLYQLEEPRVGGHTGGQAGVSSCLMFIPSLGTSASVMCNLQGVDLKPLCMGLLGVVKETKADTPVAVDPETTTSADP